MTRIHGGDRGWRGTGVNQTMHKAKRKYLNEPFAGTILNILSISSHTLTKIFTSVLFILVMINICFTIKHELFSVKSLMFTKN